MPARRVVSLVGAFALSTAAAAQRGPAAAPAIDWFFEATSFDGRAAAAALDRIAAAWHPGSAAMIVDLARFTRAAHMPPSEDISGYMPPLSPDGAPAMPVYRGAHFGTIGSARIDATAPIRARLVRFLQAQTGQRFDDDLDRWRAWLRSQPHDPHPDYPAFKAALYARVDPAIARFFAPPARAAIRLDEIEWAGVGVNDIEPLFYPTPSAAVPRDRDRVVGVSVRGVARAYPFAAVARHLLVHDRLADVEILVTHDPEGDTAAAFDLGSDEGPLRRFGTSGLAYRSLMLMFDERTRSLWSTLSGEAVVGALSGDRLRPLPVMATTWRQWRILHPESTAIAAPTRVARAVGAPAPRLTYPLPQPPGLDGAVRVAAAGGLAVPVNALRAGSVRELDADGRRVVAVAWHDGALAVYQAGHVRLLRLQRGQIEDDRGRTWQVGEDALTLAAGGERRPRLAAPIGSWAVWHAHDPALALARP